MNYRLSFQVAVLLLAANSVAALAPARGQDWAYLGSDETGQVLCVQQYSGRVVVVSFWASWCSSCLEELRALNSLQREYPQRLVVIAVNAAESEQVIARFERRLGPEHGLIFARGSEPELSAAGIDGVPQTLVLDAEGRVSSRHKGFSDDLAVTLNNEVASLLSGPALFEE